MSPELGWTTEATLSRVVDGDTIEVVIERRVKIRLKDLLVAEKNTLEGKKAKAFVEDIIKPGDKLIVFLPARHPERLLDVTSFDRLVGDVYLAEGNNLADVICDSGNGRYVNEGEKPHMGI